MALREEVHWWLATAEADFTAARLLHEAGQHNLSAFHSQQAAEKALKAVLVSRGKTQRSHACVALIAALTADGFDVDPTLESAGRRLDLHYIQARYPNGLGGDPTRYYDASISQECLDYAEGFLRLSRETLKQAS